MAYLSLYRKYRPQTFAEVVGQDHVTTTLSQAVNTDHLHHAYLFTGPRGTGKTSTARILAKAVNCDKGPRPDPAVVTGALVHCRPRRGQHRAGGLRGPVRRRTVNLVRAGRQQP